MSAETKRGTYVGMRSQDFMGWNCGLLVALSKTRQKGVKCCPRKALCARQDTSTTEVAEWLPRVCLDKAEAPTGRRHRVYSIKAKILTRAPRAKAAVQQGKRPNLGNIVGSTYYIRVKLLQGTRPNVLSKRGHHTTREVAAIHCFLEDVASSTRTRSHGHNNN